MSSDADMLSLRVLQVTVWKRPALTVKVWNSAVIEDCWMSEFSETQIKKISLVLFISKSLWAGSQRDLIYSKFCHRPWSFVYVRAIFHPNRPI